jgi:hypothetical protein
MPTAHQPPRKMREEAPLEQGVNVEQHSTILEEIRRFAVGVRKGNVEEHILQDARRRITDIIGIALAASGI